MLSPGYPLEMAYFTRALAAVGATVIGVGDQPPHAVPEAGPRGAGALRARLARRRGRGAGRPARPRPARADRPGGVPVGAVHDPGGADPRGVRAARHDRRADGAVPGQGADEADARRRRHPHPVARQRDDRRRGLGGRRADRLPAHRQADRGAGSADTYRVDSAAELAEVLPMLRHVPEVSVEEFVDAEEFTYDTVCANGKILFEHVLWYRPRPLQMRMHEWVSPVAISFRDLTVPHLPGRPGDGPAGAGGARLPDRLHAPGVVPQGGRRGRLRRDRRPAAGRAGRRPDELHHRRRPVRRVGGGGRARPDAGRWSNRYNVGSIIKRRTRLRPDHRRSRGWTRLLAEYGVGRGARRPAPGRRPAARLARQHRSATAS